MRTICHTQRYVVVTSRYLLCILFLLVLFSPGGFAQDSASGSVVSLPDAPGSHLAMSQTAGMAGISGIVVDPDGAAIPGARVTLTPSDGRNVQTLKSNAQGQFFFADISVGSYFVSIDADGFAHFETKEFTVAAGQTYVVPEISLSLSALTTSITVRPTEEIAAEQIKAEEKQRLLGLAPNFYVSYIPDAAPLTSRQKLDLALHDTLDWTSFVGVSIGAGIQQASDQFGGYGQGAAGYGKRWGALFVDGRTSDLLSRYAFASLFHQDPRYFYQGTGTKKSRLYHALSSAFVARSDNGKTMPNYSYLAGDLSAAALSNAYHPDSDRGASLVFTNAAIGIAGRAMQGVIQEFLGKRLTKNVLENVP